MKIQITAAALTALLAVLPAWSQNLGTGSAGNVTPANSGASSSGLSSGASSANAAGTRGNVSGLTINPYQTTLGFYNPYIGSGTTIHYPGFGVPKQTTGNFYSVASGNCNLPMWRAPSGYYYPWAPRPSGFRYDYYPVPVLVFDKASEAPAPAIPPMA